ncbi:type I phosphomannose isomerase catalytic subunit [Bacteriovorax sp. Seq25_V]|uniref:type I phosphomannose isomerase catalytic subunit n=1 Tax=Bacteriovorax sp. Seq25_V TaxID=1201288 RepID=UPI0006978A23|nr:type I phosphomannose isomerase catalytic subunit [Bacteriovorax sp. Seq25_V]
MKLYPLRPYLTHKIWGGTRLIDLKKPELLGNITSAEPLGETWEVSRHKDGISETLDGNKLNEIFSSEELPYLVKFIDTSDNLSIQVHPGDEYAKKHEGDSGKSECWLILDAPEGEGIYLGLKDGVDKKQLEEEIRKSGQVNELLNFYPVKAGDFFFVRSGSIHAIGKDVLMCEIQQSSGVTYRVWDWNRLDNGKPRELHIDKALDVINFEAEKNTLQAFDHMSGNFSKSSVVLTEHRDFKVELVNGEALEERVVSANGERALSVIVLSGQITADDTKMNSYESMIVKECKNLKIKNVQKSSYIIVS